MNLRFLKLAPLSAFLITLSACSSQPANHKSANVGQREPINWEVFESSNKTQKLTSQLVDEYANTLFKDSNARGMIMIAIDNNQVVSRTFGETAPGNGIRPRMDSLIRIASLSKLMTSEVMIKMEEDKLLKITDPLQKYAYNNVKVPTNNGQPIRLYHLASHTSALPREQPGGKWGRPVFTWPTRENRWTWLKTAKIASEPGSSAAYSNYAYDLLADALAKAGGKPYPQLFSHYITQPYKMKDTTFNPSAAQCKRLMIGFKPSDCYSTLAAIGSGGVYSTPADMQKWMQQFLSSSNNVRKRTATREQAIYFERDKLSNIKGMDVAGQADGLGLGWVYLAPQDNVPAIYQKTGGGGGFNTYMAMIPEQNIAVFVVITRKEKSKFSPLPDGVNALVSELSKNHHVRI